MSGAGHMAEFSRKTKQNNTQRRERLKNYKKKIGTYSESKIELKFKEVSEEKLMVIKQKIRDRIKKNRRINNLILTFSILIGFPLFIYLINLIFNY